MLDPAQKRYLPELDGLRAIAVFLVLVTHVRAVAGTVPVGSLGVTVFFVLSGYLITSIALAEENKKGAMSLGGFYVRRSFRIFPVYYLVLGIYCFLILGLNSFPEKQLPLKAALPFYLVYLQEIPYLRTAQGASLPFYQSWSLGIEEKFYLIWPLICFVALRNKTAWRISAAAALAVACCVDPYTTPYASILFGCMLALSFQVEFVRKWVQQTAAVGIWIALPFLLTLPLVPVRFWKWDLATTIYALVFAFFLGFLIVRENKFKKALSTAPLVFVGKISYGIYLVHLLCLGVLRIATHTQQTWFLLFATLGLSIAVATVLHYGLEQPLIQFGRQLSKKISNPEPTPLIVAIDSQSQA